MSEKNQESSQVPAVQAALPDYLQKYQQSNNQDAAAMATASISVPRLTYRGKRFRFIENKEEELVQTLTVKVIILGVEPDAGRFIKTYYAKGYQPGDTEPPTCSSTDGLRPDAWVTSAQARSCAECPNNVFGSAKSMKGGKAKACKDGKRLWVSKPEDPQKFYALNVPVMSLKHLSEYGKYIGRHNMPISLVITELGMDETAEYPMLTFTHSGFVEEKIAEAAIKVNTDRPWRSTFGDVPMIEQQEPMKQISGPAPQPQTPAVATGKTSTSVDDVVEKW